MLLCEAVYEIIKICEVTASVSDYFPEVYALAAVLTLYFHKACVL